MYLFRVLSWLISPPVDHALNEQAKCTKEALKMASFCWNSTKRNGQNFISNEKSPPYWIEPNNFDHEVAMSSHMHNYARIWNELRYAENVASFWLEYLKIYFLVVFPSHIYLMIGKLNNISSSRQVIPNKNDSLFGTLWEPSEKKNRFVVRHLCWVYLPFKKFSFLVLLFQRHTLPH